MLRRIVETNDRMYLFSPDDPPPLGARLWGLVKLRLIDELSGEPPDSIATVRALEPNLVSRVTSDGIGGLIGIPLQVFPDLGTTNRSVHLTVSAEGYLPLDDTVDFLTDPTFPITFSPPPPRTLALHRQPTVITGRTVRNNGGTAMVAVDGATVIVTGIWRRPPPANFSVPADPPNLVSLQPPLYAERPAPGQSMRRRNLTPVVGADKQIVDDLVAGVDQILLSDRQGLGPGDVLLLDATEPDLVEYIPIASVPITAPADQPTRITLEYPVNHAHRRRGIVQKVTPQLPGLPQQITENASAGDTCVFLDGLTELAGAQEIEINGPPGDEHHTVKSFTVVTDADGYYRMPPLSRVAQLEIHAEKIIAAQLYQATTTFRPDYRQRENRLDLTLKV